MDIRIKEPFTDQYALIVESDTKMVNVHLTSRTLMRWEFCVLNVDEYKIEAHLILLENKLLECNNPIVKDVASVSQIFSKIYGEIHVCMSHTGEVIDVLNKDSLKARWEELKEDLLQSLDKEEIRDIIRLNDDIFSNPQRIKEVVQENEFLTLFFYHIYGHSIPYKGGIRQTNFFKTTMLDWAFSFTGTVLDQKHKNLVTIDVHGKPAFILSRNFYSTAYANFRNSLNIYSLSTKLREKASYHIDTITGRLVESEILRQEIAEEEKLFVETAYNLMNYDRYCEKTSIKTGMQGENVDDHILYRGIEYTKEEWDKIQRNPWTEFSHKLQNPSKKDI